MNKNLVLSGVALSVLALACAPAAAQSINLLGGSDNGGISIDLGVGGSSGGSDGGSGTGGGSGSSGGLLNLGGSLSGNGGGGLLSLDGDADAVVNLDLDGTDGDLLDVLNDSDVRLGLFGDGNETADVDFSTNGGLDLDVDLLGTGGTDAGGLLDDSDVIFNLFGSGDDVADVEVNTDNGLDINANLLGTGGNGVGAIDLGGVTDNLVDEVNVDLFGDADRTLGIDADTTDDGIVADVDLLGGGATGGGLLDGVDVNLDLFGPDAGSGGGTGNGSGNTGGGTQTGGTGGGTGTGGGGTAPDPTHTGSTGGGTAGPGTGTGTGAAVPPPVRIASTAAAATTSGSCFSPNAAQVDHLLSRSSYDATVAAQWKAADKVQVVEVNLCADARSTLNAAIVADPNLQFLQAAVAADAQISGRIAPEHQPSDVLAVDVSADSDLTVYVY